MLRKLIRALENKSQAFRRQQDRATAFENLLKRTEQTVEVGQLLVIGGQAGILLKKGAIKQLGAFLGTLAVTEVAREVVLDPLLEKLAKEFGLDEESLRLGVFAFQIILSIRAAQKVRTENRKSTGLDDDPFAPTTGRRPREGSANEGSEFIGEGVRTRPQPFPSRGVRTGTVADDAAGRPATNKPLHIDVGGEGRYPNAQNVNPRAGTTTTPSRPIPNRVPGRGEKLPFEDKVADGISVESTPIFAETASEIARVLKPGGSVRLVHPEAYAKIAHQRVIDAVGGKSVQQWTQGGITTTVITSPR